MLRPKARTYVVCLLLTGCSLGPAPRAPESPSTGAFVVRSEVPAAHTAAPAGDSYLLQPLENSARLVRFAFFPSEADARAKLAGGELYRVVTRTAGRAPRPTHAVFAEWQVHSAATSREFERNRAALFALRAELLPTFHADLLLQSRTDPTRYLILGLYVGEEGLQEARSHPRIRAFAEQNTPSRIGARDLFGVRNFRIAQWPETGPLRE